MITNPELAEPATLRREITVFQLTMVAVGACIGSGIFLTPSDIASRVPDQGGIYLAWTIGGLVALSGSLTFSELAGRLPGEGGVYHYLRHTYGDLVAFLYGWNILTVITSGAIAALTLACARYLDQWLPLGPTGIPVAAVLLIVLLTVLNIAGVKAGAGSASLLTVLKVAGIGLVIAAGCWWRWQGVPVPERPSQVPVHGGLALALIGVFWSFGGWHHASYLAGETIRPQINVPKAMVLGAALVTAIYLAVNWAYLQILAPGEMAVSTAVASDAIERLMPGGGRWIALLIILSTLGTAGIYTLSAPRIYHTMAVQGTFFPGLARLHPRTLVPYRAILLQSAWAILLLLFWNTFENLITYVVFMDWVFMVLAAFALILLRRRREDHKGFRSPWFPLMPLVFLGCSLWFLGATLWHQPRQAWAGLALCALGLPVFLWFKRNNHGVSPAHEH
jgi:basic amino acid/polyamine antiporter, APA family